MRAHEGDVVAEVVTGDDGKAETPELYLGRYEVEETLAPDGYVLNGEPVDVTLSYAGQEVAVTRAGAVVEDAPQKGVIEIVKTDEADGRAVPGAVYEVTAAADIVTPDGTVHASSGDVVATVTTGDDGKAETDELYLGDYNVRETATPDGWAIDHETHMVELSYAGQEVKVTRTVLETADAPTTFILLKKAELIDGELVDYAGSEWHVWAEDAAGEIAYDATATTGEDGSFVLERIPHGDGLAYYCQETKTGDDYILDPEVYEFSVDEEGLIAGEPAYVFLNTNYHKRIIEAHKVDQDTGEPVGKTGFGLYRWIGEGEPDPTFGGRQGFHGVFADDPDGEVDGSLGEMVAEGKTDDTVSYTRLDVYKRQTGAVLIAVAVVWRRRARITKTFDDGSVVVLARVKAVKTGDGAWSVRVPDRLERGPKELRPTQRMMRFPSIAITRDGMVLRESAPVKVMQFDDGGGEAKLQEE